MNVALVTADEGLALSAVGEIGEAGLPGSAAPSTVHAAGYAGLLQLLKRLDVRLTAAVDAANRMFAARSAGDLNRGLAVSPADVAAALARVPGEPFPRLSDSVHEIAKATDSLSLRRLLWLQQVYGLSDFDRDVILVGLAPEIDLRYERLYAYLHDDVTRRRPSVDLALNLLCDSAGEKLCQRERFASDAPLLRHRLIELVTDPHHQSPPLLAQFFKVDEQFVRLLLLDDGLDSRLAAHCEMAAPVAEGAAAPLTSAMQERLSALARGPTPLRMYFQGPAHCGQAEAARLLAEARDVRLLNADLRHSGSAGASAMDDMLPTLVREAWLRGALLHLRGIDPVAAPETRDSLRALWRTLEMLPVHCVIEGQSAWTPAPEHPLGVTTLLFDYPGTTERQLWWQQCLRRHELEPQAGTLSALAQRYRMTFAQIEDAAAAGAAASVAKKGCTSDEDGADPGQPLLSAARAQCGHELAALTTKVESRANWEDLVLPTDQIAQLHEICDRFNHRDKVLNEWGFARKLSYGLGIAALFAGGSGTGKTMAAEVIASALGLDLYRIDLAQIVSKFIGETEKNLDKLFNAAANANAILFFDEADALFGKRSEVKDSHDRYANLEVSYLLQKMEQYEGIAILATNLNENLDQAFTRRLASTIYFPFPDEAARSRLWSSAWPQTVPIVMSERDRLLVLDTKLAGGSIRNIALQAAFLAAAEGGGVDIKHVSRAVVREYQKLGCSNSLANTFASMADGPSSANTIA